MAKETLRERLKKQRQELKDRGNKGNMIFLKADQTIRVRLLPVSEEEEFALEITQFYLGDKLKGVISPASLDEPCGLLEGYEELKNSDDPDDKEIAKNFSPKKRFVALCVKYKDLKGGELESDEPRLVLLTSGMYQDILDLYLDENEWGDMTDPKTGYDIKLSRSGSGKLDTEYSVSPCKNTPLDKKFSKKTYDVREALKQIIPSYEETKDLLAQYLGTSKDDEEETPKKKSGKKLIKKIRKSDV